MRRLTDRDLVVIALSITAVFICVCLGAYLYFNSPRWRYAEVTKKMKTVPHSDAIIDIYVSLYRYQRTSFHVTIRKDYLSKREAYQLGLDLQKVIDEMLVERTARLNGGVNFIGLVIAPVPDQPVIGFVFEREYNREEDKHVWRTFGSLPNLED